MAYRRGDSYRGPLEALKCIRIVLQRKIAFRQGGRSVAGEQLAANQKKLLASSHWLLAKNQSPNPAFSIPAIGK